MQIQTPFPVEGTITPTEYGYSASLPCESEWLTETEHGDYLQQAVDRAARKYGEGTEVRVRFTSNGFEDGCGGFELLGPSEDTEEPDEKDGDEIDELIEEAMENPPEYAEDPDEARASQFYVGEVTKVSDHMGAEVGDRQLILTDSSYPVGGDFSGDSHGPGTKILEIVSGPHDCPPFPHVLALSKWASENGLSEPLGLDDD